MGMIGLMFIGQTAKHAADGKGSAERLKERTRKFIEAGRQAKATDKRELLNEEDQALLEAIDAQLMAEQQVESTRQCPCCASGFIQIDLGRVIVDYCAACSACWFDLGELRVISGESRDVPGDDLQSRASKHHCPVCDRLMHEHVYMPPFNLLVDQCPRGHGVLLDEGELFRMLKLRAKN